MDESMVYGHVETFSTLVLETWAVASKRQRETQETEGGGEEVKARTNTCKEEGRIIEACSIKRINGYEAYESKEIATKNDIKSEMAMDESMADGRVETFSTLVPETWADASESKHETQEMEGGSEEVKAKINTCKEERRIIEACSNKRINGYEAYESKEIATKNDIESEMAMDESMADGHVETFSTLVPETWVDASESKRETQETEGGGKEVKAEANTCEEEGDVKPKRVDDDDEETLPTKVLETWALTDVRPKR